MPNMRYIGRLLLRVVGLFLFMKEEQKMQMSDAREKIQMELEKATKQKQIWENRERQLANQEKYLRSAKDRKRTHRLVWGSV